MISWSAVESAIESWAEGVATANALTLPVHWADQAHGHPRAPYVELSIGSVRPRGADDMAYEEVTSGGNTVLVPRVTGLREATVRVRVRSRSQTGNGAARYYLELFRAALAHPVLRQPLTSAGIAVLETLQQTQLDAVYENRRESIGALDFRICVKAELYLAAQSTDYVESVEVTQTVTDDAGADHALTQEITSI